MLYQLPQPTGLDFYIEALNKYWFNARAQRLWGVNGGTYNAFGRAYRNKAADGYIPEYYYYGDPTANPVIPPGYVGSSGNSNSGGLFFQDGLAAMSFFGVVDPMKKADNRDDVSKVDWIFFVDLSKITPAGITNANGQRLDEVAMNDVRNFLQSNGCGFTITNTTKDVDKVLENYSGMKKKDSLNRDMQPRFCFKITLELRFNEQLNQQPNF